VIPINCALWQPWARRQRWRYLCARRFWTSWRQVNLRLVPDQVVSPTRHNTDRVDVNNRRGGRRPDVPSGNSSSISSARGVSTLAPAMGGEDALPSAAPRGGVVVRALLASASPTTCGSGDLVREGEDGAPSPLAASSRPT
jgi:hypothetical protein